MAAEGDRPARRRRRAKAGGAAPSLTHAALEVYEATPVGRRQQARAPPIDRIPFQFNPKELSISKSAKWERKQRARSPRRPGRRSSTGADPCKLTLEMFFDATDTMDGKVVSRVEQLFPCCVPTDDSLAKKKAGRPRWWCCSGARSRASPPS